MIYYYIGHAMSELPHILPLQEKLGGVLYTTVPVVSTWMRKYSSLPCEEGPPPYPGNLILADYYNFPNHNTIQVFHGVSAKSYINKFNPQQYSHIINPSPKYPLVTPYRGFARYRKYDDQFTPGTCLYCPSLQLENLDYLNRLREKYKVICKLHPYVDAEGRCDDYKFGDQITQLGVELIPRLSENYIRYERLFDTVEFLASDVSSMMFEFSLTGRRVLIPSHDEPLTIDSREWFYDNDIFEEIKKCLE